MRRARVIAVWLPSPICPIGQLRDPYDQAQVTEVLVQERLRDREGQSARVTAPMKSSGGRSTAGTHLQRVVRTRPPTGPPSRSVRHLSHAALLERRL